MPQTLIMAFSVLAGMTGLGFVGSVTFWAFGGDVNAGAMGVLALLTLIWIGSSVILQRLLERPQQRGRLATGDEAKRGVSDMYAVIDRLVYELTPDERDYLQRRLDDTVREDDGEDDLGTTLESLLSERESRRIAD